MSKVYTVELEVDIVADSAQEAFEMVTYGMVGMNGIEDVRGICEPYSFDGGDE